MATLEDVKTWRGMEAVGSDGDKIGKIEDIYLDRQSGEPEWVAIKGGLFGSKTSFAPIRDASASGDAIRLPFSKEQVKDAPKVEADGELSPQEEQELYAHYGRSDYGDWNDSSEDRTEGLLGRDDRFDRDRDVSGTTGTAGTTGTGGTGGTGRSSFDDRPPVGDDVSGPETDNAMTRSEEELRVGTTQRETGRARLRKYVVTENVQQTVPVQREELRVEREPITDANVGSATDGPAISEEEHEVTLHAEEPVVEKRAVPKERVRLDKETVTDERTVDEEVRKERIDTEGDAQDRL
jgi:uncharacterized protein (TIGR02271 family)